MVITFALAGVLMLTIIVFGVLLATKSGRIDDLDKSRNDSIAERDGAAEKFRAQISSLNQQMAGLRQQIDNLQGEITRLEAKNAACEARFKASVMEEPVRRPSKVATKKGVRKGKASTGKGRKKAGKGKGGKTKTKIKLGDSPFGSGDGIVY